MKGGRRDNGSKGEIRRLDKKKKRKTENRRKPVKKLLEVKGRRVKVEGRKIRKGGGRS